VGFNQGFLYSSIEMLCGSVASHFLTKWVPYRRELATDGHIYLRGQSGWPETLAQLGSLRRILLIVFWTSRAICRATKCKCSHLSQPY